MLLLFTCFLGLGGGFLSGALAGFLGFGVLGFGVEVLTVEPSERDLGA